MKTPTSKNYQDYLLSAFNHPERIAKTIEVVLQDSEDLSGLLRLTLTDIIEAKIKNKTLSNDAKLAFNKLDQILVNTDGTEIYAFIALLSALGLEIKIDHKS
ncbi:hypothetical protein ACN4EE_08320 [Geminocystis sp. CENA526]